MFDLRRTFLAVVERSPDALAIVDGERRFNYAAWYAEISRVAGGLLALGLGRGESLGRHTAEPIGNGHAPLGVSVRRYCRDPAQLADQGG
jgi:non-ribosomal peptide synthetase component F